PRLASPSVLGLVFTTHYFGGPLESATAYRPVVLVTYAVQKWIHGNRVVPYHVVNVLLHAATTLVFASWLLALGFPRGPSLAAAALFAAAAIHVEAVTSLVGRAELLAALLVLVSARLFVRATEGESVARLPYALCLTAFLLAVFTKENAAVLPGVILLGELFRGGARRRATALLGLLAPLAVLFAIRKLVLHGFLLSREAGVFDLENPLVTMRAPLRIANAAGLLLRYAAKTFVPAGLSADHSAYALRLAPRLSDPQALLGLAGLVLAALLVLLLWRSRPLSALGGALFLGASLPTANLLFPIGTVYAERLAYLPSAGLFAGPILAVPRPARFRWRPALLAAAVAAQAAAALHRNPVWRSDAALYADMLAKVPGSAKAHYDFAYDAQRRDPNAARSELRRASSIFPRYYDAWALLGKLEWDAGNLDEAIRCYRRALLIFPHYENGRWGLARTLEQAGRLEEAAQAYVAGIAEFPGSYPLGYHFARFLAERGRLLDAEKEWRRSIAISGGSSLAHLGLARVLADLGREEDARVEARRALVAQRGLLEARLFLAARYETSGNSLAAAAELVRAVRTAPSDRETACAVVAFGERHPEVVSRLSPALRLVRARFGGPRKDPELRDSLSRIRG
ncbi:MAG TPA: tetratricopeptide repeat protein, partial [Thermoanaerobaculia bacterium]|nr:tetratricopeptide repeat protein [Thermoanaerobaculia bacterium]